MKKPIKGPATAADIAAEIARIETAAHDREHAVTSAKNDLRAAVMAGDQGAIAKAEAAILDASKAAEYAAIRLEGLRGAYAELVANEDQAERQALYDKAVAECDAAKVELRTLYRRMAKDAARVQSIVASVQPIIDQANDRLPDGALPITDPDSALRTVPAVPEEIISSRVAHVWCHVGTMREVDQLASAEIQPVPGNPNLGRFYRKGSGEHEAERRAFKVIRYRRAISPQWPEPLHMALKVPTIAEDHPTPSRDIEERREPIITPAADAAE